MVSSKKLIVILAVVILVIVGYSLQDKIPNSTLPIPKQAFTFPPKDSGVFYAPISTSPLVPTSSTTKWTTYENKRYKYKISHPEGMYLGTYGLWSQDVFNEQSLGISSGGGGFTFTIYSWRDKEILNNEGTKMVNVGSLELKDLAERYHKDQTENRDGSIEGLYPFEKGGNASELKEISINEKKGYSFTLSFLGVLSASGERQEPVQEPFAQYVYVFLENSHKEKYLISYNMVNVPVVVKMLQSFQFVD